MGMAQLGVPDFQNMLNSYSAIPFHLSLNASRNVKGTPGRGWPRQKKGRRPAAPRCSFSAVLILCLGSPWHFCLHFRTNKWGWQNWNSAIFENQESPFVPCPFVSLVLIPCLSHLFYFLVGWVGAVPHPLAGSPWHFCLHFIRRSMVKHH